ncbi:hypothetical protein BESB_008500 [Besnoitia besnoiti]|uniref:Transmembrane protein n=1 Tax=Besnoitia besnoiti TaxID=94643 RepID=A0A2A9MIY9_BESBE|nr:hypothetical protein BESB_008500 [Besnoitia besnoiti]PFH38508.1 hypothetical protein BESB_008500 [Besnoitia besnoiti]
MRGRRGTCFGCSFSGPCPLFASAVLVPLFICCHFSSLRGGLFATQHNLVLGVLASASGQQLQDSGVSPVPAGVVGVSEVAIQNGRSFSADRSIQAKDAADSQPSPSRFDNGFAVETHDPEDGEQNSMQVERPRLSLRSLSVQIPTGQAHTAALTDFDVQEQAGATILTTTGAVRGNAGERQLEKKTEPPAGSGEFSRARDSTSTASGVSRFDAERAYGRESMSGPPPRLSSGGNSVLLPAYLRQDSPGSLSPGEPSVRNRRVKQKPSAERGDLFHRVRRLSLDTSAAEVDREKQGGVSSHAVYTSAARRASNTDGAVPGSMRVRDSPFLPPTSEGSHLSGEDVRQRGHDTGMDPGQKSDPATGNSGAGASLSQVSPGSGVETPSSLNRHSSRPAMLPRDQGGGGPEDSQSLGGGLHSPVVDPHDTPSGVSIQPTHVGAHLPPQQSDVLEWLRTGAPFPLPSALRKPRHPSLTRGSQGQDARASDASEPAAGHPGDFTDRLRRDVDVRDRGESLEGHESGPGAVHTSYQVVMRRLYRSYCQRLGTDRRWQRQFGILVLSAIEWPLYTHKKYWRQPSTGKFFDTLVQLTDDKDDDRLAGPNVRYVARIKSCGFDAILRNQLEDLRLTVRTLDEFLAFVRVQTAVDTKLRDMLHYLPEQKLAIVSMRATLGNMYQAVSQLQIFYYYSGGLKKEEAASIQQWKFRSERRLHWIFLHMLGVSHQVVTGKPMNGVIILQVDKVESREKAVFQLFDFVENEATQKALLQFESTVTSAITMRIKNVSKEFSGLLSFGWLSARDDEPMNLPDCMVTAFYLKPEASSIPPSAPARRGKALESPLVDRKARTRGAAKKQSSSEPSELPHARDGSAANLVHSENPPRENHSGKTSGPSPSSAGTAGQVFESSANLSSAASGEQLGASAAFPQGSKNLPASQTQLGPPPIEIGQFGFEMHPAVTQELKARLPPGSMYIQLSLADRWDFQPNSSYVIPPDAIPAYRATQMLKANLAWDPSLVGVGMAHVVYTTIMDRYNSGPSETKKEDEYDNDRNLIIRVPQTQFRGEQNFLQDVMSMVVVPSLQDSAPRTVDPDRLQVMGSARRLPVGDVLKTGTFGVGIPYSQHKVIEGLVTSDSVCVHLLVKGLREMTRKNTLELPGLAIFDRFIRRSRGKYMLLFVDVVPKKKATTVQAKNQVPRQGGYPTWVLLLSNICLALFFIFVIVCLLLNQHVKLPWWVACICGSRNPFSNEPDDLGSSHIPALASGVSMVELASVGRYQDSSGTPSKRMLLGRYTSKACAELPAGKDGSGHAYMTERSTSPPTNDTSFFAENTQHREHSGEIDMEKVGGSAMLEPIEPAGDDSSDSRRDSYGPYETRDLHCPPDFQDMLTRSSILASRGGVERRDRNGPSGADAASGPRNCGVPSEAENGRLSTRASPRFNLWNQRHPNDCMAVGEHPVYTESRRVAPTGRDVSVTWGPSTTYSHERPLPVRASQTGLEQLKALELARAYRETQGETPGSMERRRLARRTGDESGMRTSGGSIVNP